MLIPFRNILLLHSMLIFLFTLAPSLNHYPNPQYYGSWVLNYLQPYNLSNAHFSLLTLDSSFTLTQTQGHKFYIDKMAGNIKKINQAGIIEYEIGIPYLKGNRIGKAKNALFNNLSSIHFFQKPIEQRFGQFQKVTYTSTPSCDLAESGCQLNISLQNQSISFNQIRLLPTSSQGPTSPSLLIADTNNHCIKEVNLTQNVIKVIAGTCGQKGFQDGAQQFNLINGPFMVGSDRQGRIFFIDESMHVRKIENQRVTTLLGGACHRIKREVEVVGRKELLCYANWLKKDENDPYFKSQNNNICTKQYAFCLNQ